ncbi:hypothetical protein HR12_21175, partial [Microbacterium sp. SUBG005]
PRIPTQAPTGSIRLSLVFTAIFAREPGSRAAAFNFDNFFADFRHFDTEQFNQHFWFRTGHEQLCTTRFRANGIQHTTDTVARAEVFTRQHVFTENHSFSVARHPFGFDFQRDVVAVHFLHHASDD